MDLTNEEIEEGASSGRKGLHWKIWVGVVLLICVLLQLGVLRVFGWVEGRYYADPTFENAQVWTFVLTLCSRTFLSVIMGSLVLLIFVPLTFQKVLHGFILMALSADLVAILVEAVPKARTAAFRSHFTSASRPLISAIDQFAEKTGTRPERLNQLVPDYLREIPGTRVARFPEYQYEPDVVEDGKTLLWRLSLPIATPDGVKRTFYYDRFVDEDKDSAWREELGWPGEGVGLEGETR